MLNNIKPLIVVLAIAAIIFRVAKPVALQFMSAEDFGRRRRLWFILTAVSFLSPNIWLYALVAVPLLLSAARKEDNPIALYLLLLHVTPPVDVSIPLLGNNGLFDLNQYRLLALCLLVPAVLRYRRDPASAKVRAFGGMDVLLLMLGLLEFVLYTPPDLPSGVLIPDSITNALRRGVLFFLDTYLLYFAVSRLCRTREKLADAAAAFCLACGIMAAIAMFEQLKGWLLYAEMVHAWAPDAGAGTYLSRGNFLRAQASAGHSLALGLLLAVASGFWLYLKSRISSKFLRIGFPVLIWGGLFATYSRGPWLGAVVIYFAFISTGPRAVSRVVKGTAMAAALVGLLALSPLGDRIFAMLPIMGRTADFNIIYRQRLAERGWELVFAHPFFGDQLPWPKMGDLRQGEGIIDIVNAYLGVALGFGLVGLFCFVGFVLLGVLKAYVRAKRTERLDPDLALLGTCLVASTAGLLLMIDSNSFNMGAEKMFFVMAGLLAAYGGLSMPPPQRAAVAGPGAAPQE